MMYDNGPEFLRSEIGEEELVMKRSLKKVWIISIDGGKRKLSNDTPNYILKVD